MAHRNVESLIGRLATDPVLRRQFAADPQAVLGELQARGELTAVERDALSAMNAAAIDAFADSLDRRIHKSDDAQP